MLQFSTNRHGAAITLELVFTCDSMKYKYISASFHNQCTFSLLTLHPVIGRIVIEHVLGSNARLSESSMEYLKMRPSVMVLLVAVAVMLAASQVAATTDKDDKKSGSKSPGSGGYPKPPSGPSPGKDGPSPGGSGKTPPPRSPGGNGGSKSPPPRGGGYSPPSNPGPGTGGSKSPPPSGGGYSPPSNPGPGSGQPDCKKKGGMCGDPKIVGGDGVVFYFHGRKNQDFCLVSDSDLHINAHFIGKRPDGRQRDFTWVQALGFVFGGHSLTIAAKRVATWDSKVDQLELTYDGLPFDLTAPWASADGAMTVNRIGGANAVDLAIKEKMGVALTVVPIGKEENRVHKYGIGDDDCFAHLDMQFRFYNLSSGVNGVLGQTYQAGFVNPVKRDVAMPIMGGADRFQSSSLLATDCKMSQYRAEAIPQGSAMPSFTAVCGSSGLVGGVPGGITCRR